MQVTVRNDTPRRLEFIGVEGRQLILAPLEQRTVSEDDLFGVDLSAAKLEGIVSHWKEPPSELMEKLVGILFAVGFVIAIVAGVTAGLDTPQWFSSRRTWQLSVWVIGGILLLLILAALVLKETKSFRLVSRFLAQMLSLAVILAIGLGLPAATVYFFGEGRTLVANPSPKLFARLLQVGFIATASLLPVLLFFLFDRYQLNTLRNRLYRDLFRLDRRLETRSEIDAEYGSQISEAYGPESQGRGRLAPGTRWPVLVCAFVVTMGWLAAFRPVGEIDAATVQNPLNPEHTALTFGFLGAYFFGLQLIARRYSRGDLKPKAYGYITIRIFTVAVLSWTLDVIFSGESSVKLLFAFLIGIVPDEFFTLVREKFRGRGPDSLVPESERHPLTKLEGIDLYDRARLEQEGIVNVESFAHHELIRLVLETRIPVPQLVDWMDQAILYLHLIQEPSGTRRPKSSDTSGPKPSDSRGIKMSDTSIPKPSDSTSSRISDNPPPDPSDTPSLRVSDAQAPKLSDTVSSKVPETPSPELRNYGIRTTTDLLKCWDAAIKRNEIDDFKKLLGGDSKPYRLEVIRDALLDDEWLARVLDWRNEDAREPNKMPAGPKSFEGKLDWARNLEEKHRYKDAIHWLELAIEIRDDAWARIRLAHLFATSPVESLRNADRSRNHARRAFDLGQDDFDVFDKLITICDENGDTDDALRACERAILVVGDPRNNARKKEQLKTLENIKTELEGKRMQSDSFRSAAV
jgi:hypothetical protein